MEVKVNMGNRNAMSYGRQGDCGTVDGERAGDGEGVFLRAVQADADVCGAVFLPGERGTGGFDRGVL